MPVFRDRVLKTEKPLFPQPAPGTGQEKDAETASTANPTGEMHYRARAYSPRQMRFLQGDPLLHERAQRPYAYVGNHPVGATDPSGNYYRDVHFNMTYYIARSVGFGAESSFRIAAADQYVDESHFTDVTRMTDRVGYFIGTIGIKPIEIVMEWMKGRNAAQIGGQVTDIIVNKEWAHPLHFPLVKGSGDKVVPAFSRPIESNTNPDLPPDQLLATGKHEAFFFIDAAHRYLHDSKLSPEKAVTFATISLGIGLHAIQDSFSHAGFTPKLGHPDKPEVDYPITDPAKAMEMARATWRILNNFWKAAGFGGPKGSWPGISPFISAIFHRRKSKSYDPNSEADRVKQWEELIDIKLNGGKPLNEIRETKSKFAQKYGTIFHTVAVEVIRDPAKRE